MITKVLSMRVGEDVHAAVTAIAERTGVPVRTVVDQLLRDRLGLEPATPLVDIRAAARDLAARNRRKTA